MAAKKKAENKAQSGPAENKAAEQEPKLATTEAGEEQAKAAAEEPKLKKAQEKRLTELAQSGYRIPAAWAAEEEDRIKHDEAVAKNMPPTQAQEHKP